MLLQVRLLLLKGNTSAMPDKELLEQPRQNERQCAADTIGGRRSHDPQPRADGHKLAVGLCRLWLVGTRAVLPDAACSYICSSPPRHYAE